MHRTGQFMMVVAVLLGAGLTAAHAASPPPTLAEQFFRVEWTAGATPQGQSRIVGYVYNNFGQDAVNVQLRITGVDASGRPVSSIIQPVADGVPALGRAFFDVQVPDSSPGYRVAVESFAFMDGEWKVRRSEQTLMAAGFQMKVADTTEKLAHLQTLSPRVLVPNQRDGQLYYVYADPDICKCLYVGTAADYQRALQKRQADDELVALYDNREVFDWGLWGAWPWF